MTHFRTCISNLLAILGLVFVAVRVGQSDLPILHVVIIVLILGANAADCLRRVVEIQKQAAAIRAQANKGE